MLHYRYAHLSHHLHQVAVVAGFGAVVFYLLSMVLASPGCEALALALTLFLMGVRLMELSALPRCFLLAAALGYAVVYVWVPDARAELWRALLQGMAFACFLSVLGMVRYPVRHSQILARSVRALLAFPARWQYSGVAASSLFLSLLFNIGIIPLVADAIAPGGKQTMTATQRDLVMASFRGAALTTCWSPLGIGFSIISASIASISSLSLFAVALTVSLVALVLTCAAHGRLSPQQAQALEAAEAASVPVPAPDCASNGAVVPARGQDPGAVKAALEGHSIVPLVEILGVCVLLLIAVLGLHATTGWPQLGCVSLLLLLLALLWLLAERPADQPRYWSAVRKMVFQMDSMGMESAMYFSAMIIGAALSVGFHLLPVATLLGPGSAAGWWVVVAPLVIVPLAGMALFPHSVLVVLLAQLIGASVIGQAHGLSAALALCCSWALAVTVSPISATTLLTGNACGVSARTVGQTLNRNFALMVLAVGAASVSILYALGY